ncbi:MAG: ABC transporter permease [Defluviitaleaceae bacterium]|nr:ABC transporter permease [Defluviitaleaceae bacterium]
MSLTAKLALQQLKRAKKRTAWTLAGIGLSVGMIVAVNGFAASAMAMFSQDGRTLHIWERMGFLIIAAILGAIIATASIIVISNAFRVSAVERIRQFGILKSVGATSKQISATVMYEALFLSAVGLPLGIVLGIATQFFATAIANHILAPTRILFPDFYVRFLFVISGTAIALGTLGAFIMILISAWLPARKASKAPAVSAIMGDVKIKKSGKFGISRLLFGFEGQLAAGQLKRSRRNFRASIISLTISIVMVLAAASAQVNLMRQIDMMYDNVDANVRKSIFVSLTALFFADIEASEGHFITLYDADGNLPGITTTAAREMTELLRDFPGATVRGYGYTNYTHEFIFDDGSFEGTLRLIVVEDELYATLAAMAGVPMGSNILLNVQRLTDILGVTHETNPWGHMVETYLDIFRADAMSLTDGDWAYMEVENTRREIYIHGQVTSLPDPMLQVAYNIPTIVVPDMLMGGYEWFIQTDDPSGFTQHAIYVRNLEIVNAAASIRNLDITMAEREVISNLATVFVGGFVGMLTLIGITNVISTISTNTKLRIREFAILTSVGMTRGGLGKMLALESILCSIRALIFGLPLGVLAAYGVYYGTQMDRVRFSFIFPWQAFLICIAGVFVLTFVTTMFSAYRLCNENIIEAIR